jgi:hypothetical protein
MLAGNPLLRNTTGESRGICHRCVNKNSQPFGGAPCTEGDTTFLPTRMCEGGIRTQITFPTCWNGVNLDSPDHQSHVAYAEIPYEPYVEPFTPVEQRGKCPEGFPVMLPQVMYEVMFDTVPFNQKELWGQNGTQPFVFSMGDAYVSLDRCGEALALTVLIGLVMVIMAIICLGGRAMRCSGRWMRDAATISAVSWRGRAMRMR